MRSALLNIMVKAAHLAGRSLVHDFNEVEKLQVSLKGPADFVSSADRQAESIIRESLASSRPEFSFLMEESGAIAGNDPDRVWVVDPLDGTTNFLNAVPLFAVAIALVENDEVRAGVTFNPVTDELFVAERGRGAFFNNQRLRVSAQTRIDHSLVSISFPSVRKPDKTNTFYSDFQRVSNRCAGIRGTGSAALDMAWTAAGRFDCFWGFGLKPWDIASGLILLAEAGGEATALNGKAADTQTGDLVVTNGHLHQEITGIIRG